jgi:hypothetical protein
VFGRLAEPVGLVAAAHRRGLLSTGTRCRPVAATALCSGTPVIGSRCVYPDGADLHCYARRMGDGNGVSARDRPSSRRRVLVAAGVFVLVASVLGTLPMVWRATESPRAGAQPVATSENADQSIAVLCRASEPGQCDQRAADILGRTPLTESERSAAEAISRKLVSSMPSVAQPDCDDPGPACEMLPSPASVSQVRRALNTAGFSDVVIRPARAGDPASVGDLLVAVAAGPACVIIIDSVGTRQATVAGRQPDGTCLRA